MTTLRDAFMLDEQITFLNHGSFGACPHAVFETYQMWQRELERQPVEFLGRRADGLLAEARDLLAAYVGADPENLTFVPNATTGMNMVARSLAFNPGDEVLMCDHEYGAMEILWNEVANWRGLYIERAELPDDLWIDPQAVADVIWQYVTPRTKVLFLSHITSPTALILPIELLTERAREAGILTCIDGAHAPGQLTLDLEALGADFYTGNAHKWLCAPKGSAFLYVRPEHHEKIDPYVISWGQGYGHSFFERTLWQGTRDIAAYLSVPAAIEFQQAHDWGAVRARCHDLAVYAAHRIAEITQITPLAMPRFHAQMSAAALPPLSDDAARALKQHLYDDFQVEIPVTTVGEAHYLRISVQAYNTLDDVERMAGALQTVLQADQVK